MSRKPITKKPSIIVFTAPSGAGKTTIVKHLLKTFDDLAFSISATSREKRKHEVDGKDYYFVGLDGFRKLIREDALLEWQEVYSNQYYGTLKREIERLEKEGKRIIFDIDVKGAVNIKDVYGDDALVIFIKPPSVEELLKRLQNRKTENKETLKKRIYKAKEELKYESAFDKVLINDDLELALKESENIVRNFLQI